jgi:hypothetical protein
VGELAFADGRVSAQLRNHHHHTEHVVRGAA